MMMTITRKKNVRSNMTRPKNNLSCKKEDKMGGGITGRGRGEEEGEHGGEEEGGEEEGREEGGGGEERGGWRGGKKRGK